MAEMKDSGVVFIGNIPKEWDLYSVKHLFKIGRGRVISELELDDDGKYPVYSSQTKNEGCMGHINTYDFDIDQLTWTTDGVYAGTVFIRHGKHNCTNVCGTLQPNEKNDNDLQYLKYALECIATYHRRKDINGGKIMNNEMARIKIPIPPKDIQINIADFLDKKCAVIDALHTDIEKQIETLEEYKKLIITEAVTKGLNPDVETKDSGIEWIGMIPKHWKIYRYKHLASLVRGGSPRPAGNPIYYYGDIPFMKVADITKDDRMYVDSCEGSIKPAGLSNTRMVSKGTLLLTNSGATLGVPKILNIDTTINDGIAAFLNLSNKLNIKFAYYSLKSKTEYFLQVAALGMGQPNLNTDIIGNTYVTIPPKYEQQKIIEFLDVKCAEIDGVIRDKKEQLETLEQYKKSVIYEYVTGKKEVQ